MEQWRKSASCPAMLRVALIAFAVASGAPGLALAASAWPDKPIRIISPWAPGGSTDFVTRILGADMSKRLGQSVVIDHRAGAGGIVGMEFASQQPPDGYTLMLTSTGYGFIINKAKVDLTTSFVPVSLVGFSDSLLVVHPSLPVKTVKELIALAKRRPGQLNYASSGVGGFPHLNTEMFKLMAGVDLVHVPFKGGGPAVADNVAGNTQLQLGSLTSSIAMVRSGRLRAIAVGGATRTPLLPDLPTISESGVPGYESFIWFGLFSPRGTPGPLVASIHSAVMASLDSPELIKRFDEQGVTIARRSTAEFAKLMESETAKWTKVIKAANITGE